MLMYSRDEECLPVGGIVLQQLMVFDMGNIPPAELLTLAVELIRQAEHGEQRPLDPDLYRLAALPDEKPPKCPGGTCSVVRRPPKRYDSARSGLGKSVESTLGALLQHLFQTVSRRSSHNTHFGE
jgi:hypothetical protein